MNKNILILFMTTLTVIGLSSCYQHPTKLAEADASGSIKSKGFKAKVKVTAHLTTKRSPFKVATNTQSARYIVFGRSYHVLNTSRNYHEIGLASWYGRPFHHRYTSSGERYNMYEMTAAHKTLPLSTYVQVTNLSNHRQVIVKINDRGPFVGKRVIDLSYAAAKKLGMVGEGVAKVSITALPKTTYNA